ncbi:MAG: hypothetical protein IKC20_06815, partial [Clostridia bacterium]|nr:hypothetical protein [Clostridia bacterium]
MKALKKVIAVVLSLCMVFGCVAAASSATAKTADTETETVDKSFITSSITSNRKLLDPVYVRIDGKAYNLLNPIEAIIAMIHADTEQEKETIGYTYLELVFMTILNCLAVPAPVAN